jgi:dipeptidyl aminopeptidase/acylaminoacyl peptidase
MNALPMRRTLVGLACASLLVAGPALSQTKQPTVEEQLKSLQSAQENLQHDLDQLAKSIDDVLFYQRLGDVAEIDKWRIAGPPPAHVDNPKEIGATNPVRFYLYTFVPKNRKAGEKLPMVVLPHGGVHADFTTYYTHILREMLSQGYVVVAPEYRGSTGYGRGFYELIDYGGREVDDCHAAAQWALQNFDFVDPSRVGLVGWSHGGLIVLMLAFQHPKDYQCVFAGMPVSDLVQRMGYSGEGYRRLYSVPYHIGKTAGEDQAEYQKRSPAWHAGELQIPLLIHTNTNDEDVHYIEVQHLIEALKAEGKKFEYKVFDDAPGGHSADRMDTPFARSERKDIYAFLAKYLRPPRTVSLR